MVRGRDACWEHCVLVDATKQKVRCKYCHREFSGGVYRMKFHLAQIKNKDIVPCTEVPDDVRDHIRTIISTPKKQKITKKLKVDLATNGGETSSSASGGILPNQGSNGQPGSSCHSLSFPEPPSPRMQPAVEDAERKNADMADKKVAVFLLHNAIPFAAANSIYYQEMFDAVAVCGKGYKGPSCENLRSVLLERVKGDIHDLHDKYRKDWKETGCTILCESWYDGRSRSKCLVVFSVACSIGALFLKSADVSGHEDDANYLFELLESVVLEVGVDNVIQVVTDAAASYIYAGRLLTNKYNSLFWSPCASNCIDKMLEDISKQEWVATVLKDSNLVVKYIYSNAWTLGKMRQLTGGRELIRPRINRFAANFLSLRSIVMQEDKLKLMFSHSEWSSSVHSSQTDAQVVKALLFQEQFWESANEAVSITEPLVKLLRIVDGDMPAMGYIYGGLERAKFEIRAYYKGVQEKYFPIWDIIDRRWSIQLHSPLHGAAAFLNPSFFSSPKSNSDTRIRNRFQEAMLKMATTEADKMEITKEHPIYVNSQGALGTSFAIMGRTLNSPGDWWSAYGYEIPTLQRLALRILNQPCSSHWCRWNWVTFENAHGTKRKKWEMDKLNDLIFVHCNLWLQAIGQSRRTSCKPIVYDDLDVGLEWPTELVTSIPPLNDTWLDNFFLEGKAFS